MKREERIFKALDELGSHPSKTPGQGAVIRREVDGYMTLVLENLGAEKMHDGRKVVRVSMAHYFEQNGDLVADPDVVFFVFPETGRAYAAEMSMPGMVVNGREFGGYSVAAKIEGGKMFADPRRFNDLQRFAAQWVSNLKAQGFFKAEAVRA
ncbi:MAG TPA: hypothetical protein PKY99_00040 [Turneriella sp.]|nr:hypothetical protein [Turneriella sp.]